MLGYALVLGRWGVAEPWGVAGLGWASTYCYTGPVSFTNRHFRSLLRVYCLLARLSTIQNLF